MIESCNIRSSTRGAREFTLIGNRYRIINQLGTGGMGTVYRAKDRLTGQMVALKRVMLPPERSNSTEGSDFRLALAREFKTLASLRHPHIISVLDYGFDLERNPYFTMELIEDARDLYGAAKDQPREFQIDLLIQFLKALVYLHRHGIIHRDLKPANVLVTNDQIVKVLDFGIAQADVLSTGSQARVKQVAGTLLYMAPELLMEEPASIASDLYAFGIIAYEILSGKYPYPGSIGSLVLNIMTKIPDVSDIGGNLGEVIARLLAKNPRERYEDANAVIQAIYTAIEAPIPPESHAERESLLNAARFVGRVSELDTLKQALSDVQTGQGSMWLIGGESGVGKSRLCDELRTYALVEKCLVLRGQAIVSGGLPFQLWRQPVRRLLLSTHISELETVILRDLVIDIDQLVREADAQEALNVGDTPPSFILSGNTHQERLIATVIHLMRSVAQQQPILLLLEDLQWATESLKVLQALHHIIHEIPMLIVGNYRVEDAPYLADEFPEAHVIYLERLKTQEIAALSEAMLGPSGQAKQVVQLLQRETEGNVFFVTEVVRALAEDVGRLDDIGTMTLPEHVIAGGVQTIIAQRLSRIPHEHQRLIQLAAVAGRQIDTHLMQYFHDKHTLDTWLTTCVHAAVLEVSEGQWRFAHDKLREATLNSIPLEMLPALHEDIAEVLEALYSDQAEQAVRLAYHWRNAGNPDKERIYTLKAGEYAEKISAYTNAIQHYRRGLELLVDAPDARWLQADLMLRLGTIHIHLADYNQATLYLNDCISIARVLDDTKMLVDGLCMLANVLWRQGNDGDAERFAQRSLKLAQAGNYERGKALALLRLGTVRFDLQQLEEAVQIARTLNDTGLLLLTLNNLGVGARASGYYEQATRYHQEQLALARMVGSQGNAAFALNNLASIAMLQGELDTALEHIQQALQIHRVTGQRALSVDGLVTLSMIQLYRLEFTEAQRCLDEAVLLARAINYQVGILDTKNLLGDLAYYQGDYVSAKHWYDAYYSASIEISDTSRAASAIWSLGNVARQLEDKAEAQALYLRALKMQTRRVVPFLAGTLIGLAGTLQAVDRALAWIGLALAQREIYYVLWREAEQILDQIRNQGIDENRIQRGLQAGQQLDLAVVIQDILATQILE